MMKQREEVKRITMEWSEGRELRGERVQSVPELVVSQGEDEEERGKDGEGKEEGF